MRSFMHTRASKGRPESRSLRAASSPESRRKLPEAARRGSKEMPGPGKGRVERPHALLCLRVSGRSANEGELPPAVIPHEVIDQGDNAG